MDDGADCELPDDSRVVMFDEVVDGAEPIDFSDRVTDERQGAAICYTTGTTGNPKGVFYSHRSMWLHSNAALAASTFGLRESRPDAARRADVPRQRVGFAVRVVHGRRIVRHARPGPVADDAARADGVRARHGRRRRPDDLDGHGRRCLHEHDLSALRTIICGGSAVPKVLSEAWREKVGIPITQAWGMTETSPIASVWIERSEIADRSEDEKANLRTGVGIAPPGVELRIVDAETARGTAVGRRGDRRTRVPRPVGRQAVLPHRRARRAVHRATAGCAPVTSRRSRRSATSAWSTARRT